jgi:hypothetical protein
MPVPSRLSEWHERCPPVGGDRPYSTRCSFRQRCMNPNSLFPAPIESAGKPVGHAAAHVATLTWITQYQSTTNMVNAMKTTLLLWVLAGGTVVAPTASFAQTRVESQYPYSISPRGWPYQGQYPLPPSLTHRTAQPECGFAAIEDWGPNGFQWCDSKNMNPGTQIGNSDAFGQFVPSGRAGSISRHGGRRHD